MNLHQIASGQIAAVNPFVLGTVQVSVGSTVDADGTRIPTYNVVTGVSMQVQPMSWKDIQQVDGLNLQGTRCSIYINGVVNGLVRPANDGGDLIVLTDGPNAGTWLVAMVLEQWPDWCKVAVTLQNNA